MIMAGKTADPSDFNILSFSLCLMASPRFGGEVRRALPLHTVTHTVILFHITRTLPNGNELTH